MRRRSLKGRIEQSRKLVETLSNIADDYSVSASQVALNWLVNFHGDIVVAIPGATKVEHARQNCLAMTFRLTEAEMAVISDLSAQFICQ